MTLRPGVDGNNSGLFTPSRRALAGGMGRKSGEEAVMPATTRPCIIADRRETVDDDGMKMSSFLGGGVENLSAEDDSRVVASGCERVVGANASAERTVWRRKNAVNNECAMVDGR